MNSEDRRNRHNEPMVDKFANFAELKAVEPKSSYRIEARAKGTAVALIAPHAGKIEPGTSEICKSVARDDLSYYLFEGKKANNNSYLHITSSRFDEPQGVSIAQSAMMVLTFHGQRGNDLFVNVGGLALPICETLIQAFNDEGFPASRHSNKMLQGNDVNNICNRGSIGQGVQLEISRALRVLLTENEEVMARFSRTIRSVLELHGHYINGGASLPQV